MASHLGLTVLLVLVSSASFALADEPIGPGQELPANAGVVGQHVDENGAPMIRRTIRVHEVSPPVVETPVPRAADVQAQPASVVNAQPSAQQVAPAGINHQDPFYIQEPPQSLAVQSGYVEDSLRLGSDNLASNLGLNSGNQMMNGAMDSNNVKHQFMTNSGNTEVVHMDGVGNSKVTKISNAGNNELSEQADTNNNARAPPQPAAGVPVVAGLGNQNPLVQINMNELGAARFGPQRPPPMSMQMPMPIPSPMQPAMWPFQYIAPQPMPSLSPAFAAGLPIADVERLPGSVGREARRVAREMAQVASQPMQILMAPMQVPQFAMQTPQAMFAMANTNPMAGVFGPPAVVLMPPLPPTTVMAAHPQPIVKIGPNPLELEARRRKYRKQRPRRKTAKKVADEDKGNEEPKEEPQQVVVVDEQQPKELRPKAEPVRRIIEERVIPVPVAAPVTTTTTPAPEPEPEIEYETIRVPKGQLNKIPGFDPRNLVRK